MERENGRMYLENAELRRDQRLPEPATGDPGDAAPVESELEGQASHKWW